MKSEEASLVLKYFEELATIQFDTLKQQIVKRDKKIADTIRKIPFENGENQHNNRIMLFRLMNDPTIGDVAFATLVECLQDCKYKTLAAKLSNKPLVTHKTSPFVLPIDKESHDDHHSEPLTIDVKHATEFRDVGDAYYRTRSIHRASVLVINNMNFTNKQLFPDRNGAEVDEHNLRTLYEQMGVSNSSIHCHRNLTVSEMKAEISRFAKSKIEQRPDMVFVFVLSHGEKIDNKTCIVGTDDLPLDEGWIVEQFNNVNCQKFKSVPKIFVFHVCRGNNVDSPFNFYIMDNTETDGLRRDKPEERTHSDMLFCYPSFDGFLAHRHRHTGSWYIQLFCLVLMNHAHEMDLESMLKLVENKLRMIKSEDLSGQTSVYCNTAFKELFINPGIYEEGGEIKKLPVSSG